MNKLIGTNSDKEIVSVTTFIEFWCDSASRIIRNKMQNSINCSVKQRTKKTKDKNTPHKEGSKIYVDMLTKNHVIFAFVLSYTVWL